MEFKDLQKLINNTTWTSPFHIINILTFFILIFITITLETFFIWYYAKEQQYTNIGMLLVVVISCNFLTGLIGLVINLVVF